MQQLEVAGTVFSGKAPGPAMYDRVSKALAELGYERTPSQCRERMKTLRRCYSRVKEHGIGKRKSSYSLEQLEKVFGQGGWDSQPVLINSSGLYQEMESDGSTMEEYSQEAWGSQDPPSFPEADSDTVEIRLSKKRLQLKQESSDDIQQQEVMRNVVRILESSQAKWEPFQTWMDFSRLHLSNKLAIFGVGYNTRWREEIRYHHAEMSSQVPLGKRLREYFNPEKAEGRVIMTKVQKMNWKSVFYKFLDITISEARCLELHMEVGWIPVSRGAAGGYQLPEGIPRTHGLYAVGFEDTPPAARPSSSGKECSSPESSEPDPSRTRPPGTSKASPAVTYCFLGVAEDRTLHQCLHQHFRTAGRRCGRRGEPPALARFLQENSAQPKEGGSSHKDIYIKFIEVELDFLSAGSLLECLEMAVGYSLKFNEKETL
ncbi:hypothetical protein MATL_G00123520 [Megalops atlanticus]|uniref:Myb/SANT-like DNA-binding domain-containing protein n=1 Tax=Megalops atlanticus TaxID=7932 RepID=A0A9D3PZ25_MEGAT|nr:hypothetical protein MATL_G00123520 [Megalops atlanticus]